MAWSLFDKKSAESGEWSGFLDRGAKIQGKLECPGTLRLDTEIDGSITSEAALILGAHAQGKGDLVATSIVVAGRFDGVIRARQKVELQPKAVVTGEIHTPNLSIEAGAIFDGNCHVISSKDPEKPIVVRVKSSPHPE